MTDTKTVLRFNLRRRPPQGGGAQALAKCQQQRVGEKQEDEKQQRNCKQVEMPLPQEGKISIIEPHSMWHQLVTCGVSMTPPHTYEAECCDDGIEELVVGK